MENTAYNIKKIFSLFILGGTLLSSCGGSSWSKEQKDTFLDECGAEGGSNAYCHCYLEKMMEKYPNHADSKKIDFESAVEMAKSCE